MTPRQDQTTITVRKRTLSVLRQVCKETGCTRISAADILGRAWGVLTHEQKAQIVLNGTPRKSAAEVAA